jgi:hypothetical protein
VESIERIDSALVLPNQSEIQRDDYRGDYQENRHLKLYDWRKHRMLQRDSDIEENRTGQEGQQPRTDPFSAMEIAMPFQFPAIEADRLDRTGVCHVSCRPPQELDDHVSGSYDAEHGSDPLEGGRRPEGEESVGGNDNATHSDHKRISQAHAAPQLSCFPPKLVGGDLDRIRSQVLPEALQVVR